MGEKKPPKATSTKNEKPKNKTKCEIFLKTRKNLSGKKNDSEPCREAQQWARVTHHMWACRSYPIMGTRIVPNCGRVKICVPGGHNWRHVKQNERCVWGEGNSVFRLECLKGAPCCKRFKAIVDRTRCLYFTVLVACMWVFKERKRYKQTFI